MISVWPNPMYCPQEREFRQAGLMLEHSVYDAFSDEGRDMYWRHINDEFFSQGFDAWWCDCSEPVDADWKWMPEGYGWDSHKERW
jgi:alpha-D-xyloside xylohydrolase